MATLASIGLILVSFQVETNNPRPACDTLQSLRVRGQPRQAIFKLMHDPGHLVEHAIGKLLLPELIPDVFLRIELGSIRRQAHEADIPWERKVFGAMRAGAIQDHDDGGS